MIRFVKRLLRRFVLGIRSGYDHATWGYSLRETFAHLRRPQPWRISFGTCLGLANAVVTSSGCLACPTVKELQEVR
jgi:hypothetical protein